MGRVLPRDLAEAEKLLQKIHSWSEDEVEQLPRFYKEKARELREKTGSNAEG
ncbi:hypothetical protein [Halosimplex salinum]|uniref:hypothetical protein n=1 Tax=Halosimplex salinum TaxID=1710538 RepID=UPI0013DE21BC|nr:hypothetical protein [Halosimplex salinum]